MKQLIVLQKDTSQNDVKESSFKLHLCLMFKQIKIFIISFLKMHFY